MVGHEVLYPLSSNAAVRIAPKKKNSPRTWGAVHLNTTAGVSTAPGDPQPSVAAVHRDAEEVSAMSRETCTR